MKIISIKTRIFCENENLLNFILKYIKKIPENSIIVITSKIVALSEGRFSIVKNKKEKEKFIKKESDLVVKTKFAWLTIKNGMIMASAGIDESNANGKIIFLPKDSFYSANFIRNYLLKKYKVKNLGILITDSQTFPLRAGVIGSALGYAGFKGIRDYRGKPDIFGRKMKISRTNIADCLATTAVLSMGEGDEKKPLAVIYNAPVLFKDKINRKELMIDLDSDLYFPFLKKINKGIDKK